MVQFSATRCNCIAILWVSLVSFATITLCVTSQRVFIVNFVIDSVRKLLDTPSYLHNIKGKVVPVLFLNWASRHESVLGEWKYSSTRSLTSALDGGEWSASWSGCFTPRERAPGTHWIRGWVGPRAVLDAVVKDRGFESQQGLGMYLFTTASRTALGPSQHPTQWVPGALSLEVNRPVRESILPIRFHGVVLS
jgi:hypothetical protein